MSTTGPSHDLQLIDTAPAGGGCGCGGCGCGDAADAGTAVSTPTSTPVSTPAPKEATMAEQTYAVTGMTCGHCASAVTSELTALDGVTDVHVDLVAGGTSTVTVTSTHHLAEAQVTAALDEAGDYRLA